MDKPFQLVAGHPALDFANTLDDRYNPRGMIELIDSYGALLRFCVQASLLTEVEARSLLRHGAGTEHVLREARELREAIELIFAAVADGRKVAAAELSALNQHVRNGLPHRMVERANGSFAWTWDGLDRSPEGPLWPIAYAAAELLASERRGLVRRCECDTCRWLFLDESKNHSRKWCDMKLCGNRMKARSYYERRSKQPS